MPGSDLITLAHMAAAGAERPAYLQVLKRTRADGGHLITVSEMLDGVVVFQDEHSADLFGEMLEADGHRDVSCAQCDSHELFRMVSESRAVVVLCTAAADVLPRPEELATAVRSGDSKAASI